MHNFSRLCTQKSQEELTLYRHFFWKTRKNPESKPKNKRNFPQQRSKRRKNEKRRKETQEIPKEQEETKNYQTKRHSSQYAYKNKEKETEVGPNTQREKAPRDQEREEAIYP